MKTIKIIFLLLLAAGMLAANVARAESGRFHGGFHGARVGVFVDPWPLFYPFSYYPYGYYPYAPVVVNQAAAPTTYVERDQAAPAQSNQQQVAPATRAEDWYYCRKPAGYYPYVRSCAEGWQRVPAQPPAQN